MPIENKKDRNLEIIEKIESAKYTMAELGREYGISRERIRQLYKRATHKGFRPIQKRRTSAAIKERKKARATWLKEERSRCVACGKAVYNGDGRRCSLCVACRDIQHKGKEPRVTLMCKKCSSLFHPYKSTLCSKMKPQYCSMSCYHQDRWRGGPDYLGGLG